MASQVNANSTVTSESPTVQSGVSSGIRITLALLVAIILGIFMLCWDAYFIPHDAIPNWVGPFIFMPLMATVLGFGSDCLVQQLSCGKVQWLIQLQRVAIIPVPFLIMWAFLYMIPGLRWPIEGLVQPHLLIRKGLSSGFYAFWIGLYCQSLLNGVSQMCPK
jgi:hypothetical protein